MSKKINIAVAVVLFGFLLLFCAPRFTAHANSAQTHWFGRDSFGAYVVDENCPVEVESEKLTLRVPHFPDNHYDSEEQFASYEANVTAEYTFHNPADYDVEMTLAFPFGKMPDYLYGYYDWESQSYRYFDDTSRYAVTADGEEVSRNLRYTLNSWKFDPQTDLARISSEKRSEGFISPDTPVTVYTYEFYPEKEGYSTCFAANFYGLGDSSKTLIMLQEFSMAHYEKKTEMCGAWLHNNYIFEMYVIGEPLEKMPEWKMYENGHLKKEVAGEVKLSAKLPPTTITFNELALSYYMEECGVSEVDYYNAVLDRMFEYYEEGRLVSRNTYMEMNVYNNLMRWYEYELSIPSGGHVVNSVTAPLYPAIDMNWNPAKYSYTYLLSPASTWADFGSFEVEIQTPYYVTDSSLSFERVDGGYKYMRQGLPEGELTFSLSSSESPQRLRYPTGKDFGYFMLYYGIPAIFALVAVGIVVGIVLIIIKVVRKKKGKQ